MQSIATLHVLYRVTFDLFISAFNRKSGGSVLRVTNTDTEKGNNGDQIIAMYVHNEERKFIFSLQKDYGNDWYYKHDDLTVKANTWYNVAISRVFVNGTFRERMFINDEMIKETWDQNYPDPFPFNNVAVYVGETFKKAIPGYVDNLSITSGKSFLFPGSLARSLTTRKSNTFSQAGKPVSVGIHYWNCNPLLFTGRSDTLIPLGQTKWLKGDSNF